MERVAFRLKVRSEQMDEYVRRHTQVWPEMLDALRSTGWTNYWIEAMERFLATSKLLI